MATVYSGSRYNSDGTTGWRIRVDYADSTAYVYADVVSSYTSSSIWLRFTTGNNTCSKAANTYYSSNNGKSANLLGTISISPYSATTVYQTCSGSAWGGTVNGESSVTIPQQYSPAGPTYSRSVSGITRTSATLNVSCSSNPASYWRIHWYNTSGSWVGYSGNGATGSWTYTQSDLTPNTSYNFYTQVTNNSDGEGTGLSPIGFTTSGNAPTINSITVSPSRTSATLSPSASFDTNASQSNWTIRYGTSTSYNLSSNSFGLTNLTPNTTYYYSVTVTDNWGRTSAAKTGSFKTTGNNPTINSHGVKTYTQTSVEMQYSASYDTNDSLSSYKWEYGTSTSYGSSVTGTNTISRLSANTTYYYKLTVTGTQGRSSTATGSFKTDPATVTISALGISEITETTAKVDYTFNNPSNVEQFYVIETILEREDGTSQSYQVANAIPPYSKVYDNLEPGSKYTCKARVGIKGQSGTIYYSQWASQDFETLASSPFVKIDSDGTIKHYKGYALGKADVYNGYGSEWSSGIYSGTSSLVLDTTSNGVSKLGHIEVLPNTTYTIQIPEQLFNGQGRFFFTNATDGSPTSLPITAGSSTEYHTSSDQTRLYISFVSTSSNSDFTLNVDTARYISCHVYKESQKVMLDKESIVTLNNKIRYIDISQKGYTKDGTDYTDGKIVELDVYDKSGNNISLGKTVTIEKGTGLNPENVTNGSHDGLTYCKLNNSSNTTTVRVDLEKEYSYDQIDRVILWRETGCTYQESRLLGLDASKQITWKFHSYKSEGAYQETANGYIARARKAKTNHTIYISSILNTSDNPPFANKITINADWDIAIPPVITDLTTHRVDAIIAANSGRLLKNDIGDLTALTTTEKTNLVDAINEIWNNMNKTNDEFTTLDFVLDAIICD